MSKSVTTQSMQLDKPWGGKPLIPPRHVQLDLLFFRRVFSNLHRRYGDSNKEVPVTVFQRSVVRLFRMLGMKECDFDASAYDVDGSGAVGWNEFVTCWRKSEISVEISMPEQIFLAIEDPGTCIAGQVVNSIVTLLILVSCICFILGTLPGLRHAECPSCEPEQPFVFDMLEAICVAVFTAEYLARVVTAPFSRSELLDYERILKSVTEQNPVYLPSPPERFLRFLIQPMNIIDVFVIMPFYLENMIEMDAGNFTVLRVLRLTRLFRLVKLGKYFEVVEILVRVLSLSKTMFYILGVYLVLGVCFSSAAMYIIEGGSWDSETRSYMRTGHDGGASETPFLSIPHASWWCIVTFTTVGYGDIIPVTVLGKLFASATMLIGVLVLAMPISVISMNFGTVWEDWNEERRMAAEGQEDDLLSVTRALMSVECKTLMHIQLFDDRLGREEPEFLGEVEFANLPVFSESAVSMDTAMPLQPRSRRGFDSQGYLRKPRGTLLASFTWLPQDSMSNNEAEAGCSSPAGPSKTAKQQAGRVVVGRLEVRVQRAHGLEKSDWKKSGCRDVYCVVRCWPRPPISMDEDMTGEQYRTRTVRGSLDPVWDEKHCFHFDWPKDWQPPDSPSSRQASPKAQPSAFEGDLVPTSAAQWVSPRSPDTESRCLHGLVEAQGRQLRHLASEVADVRELLRDIRGELRSKESPNQRLRGPEPWQRASLPEVQVPMVDTDMPCEALLEKFSARIPGSIQD